jgi:hypothetical protein
LTADHGPVITVQVEREAILDVAGVHEQRRQPWQTAQCQSPRQDSALCRQSPADSATLTRPFRDPRVPLPGTEGQPGGATLRRIFLPASPTSSYLGGPDLLARRTKSLFPGCSCYSN